MSSVANFCEAPIRDGEWLDAGAWPEEHWYDFEPISVYTTADNHDENHARNPAPLLFNVEHLFQSLAEQWDAETAYLSSVHEMVLNPAYQRIIGLGPLVLPSLLRDLQQTSRFWFWALASITRENPVPDEELGDIKRMTERWIHWGQDRGLLT